MLMVAGASPLHCGAPRVSLGFPVLRFAGGLDLVKSPVSSDDDISVCLPSVPFLCVSCSCLAADGKASGVPSWGLPP